MYFQVKEIIMSSINCIQYKWAEWQKSGDFYKINGLRFYWVFGHMFEKNQGRTSTRATRTQAENVYNEMKAMNGSFESAKLG